MSDLGLNIGCGTTRYDNFVNIDITNNSMTDLDVQANGLRLPFKNESFTKVAVFQILEHIERKYHAKLFDEVWRVLQEKGGIVVCCPDSLEVMQRFIDNRYGERWDWYNLMLYGRQLYQGDYHVTATERRDVTDRLFASGFIDVDCTQEGTELIFKATKGEESLPKYL
jgi:SAM-dependent methyltransferase